MTNSYTIVQRTIVRAPNMSEAKKIADGEIGVGDALSRDFSIERTSDRLLKAISFDELDNEIINDKSFSNDNVIRMPLSDNGPKWPVIQNAPRYELPPSSSVSRYSNGWETCVILPDMQVGYYRGRNGQLEPLHDERAMEVALSIAEDINPDLIVLVGDNADFAELGKYRVTPAFQQTTQATIDRLGLLAAQLRSACPDSRIVWLAGNHEERLPNMIIDNAVAAFGLRKANMPDSWPVLSLPGLCNFDEYDIEFFPGYPASAFWINDKLRVIHGDRVKSGGSTAHAYLAREKTSVIYGHIHRREYGARTREDRDGAKEVMAASPGCLARIDGVVPSTKGGTDLDGRPIRRFEDWQQGLAIVYYEPNDGRFVYNQIAIHDGWAMWNGKEYLA
jgi:predicted phosphodiesterase